MNKRILTFISISFSVALLILISFQVYWIRNDFKVREDLFREKVDEALTNTASKLERLDHRGEYTKITKRTQGVLYPNLPGQGSLPIGIVSTELSTDSNGHQSSRYTQKDLVSADSIELMNSNLLKRFREKQGLKSPNTDLQNPVLGNQVFNFTVREEYYDDRKQKIDTLLLDSILRSEVRR